MYSVITVVYCLLDAEGNVSFRFLDKNDNLCLCALRTIPALLHNYSLSLAFIFTEESQVLEAIIWRRQAMQFCLSLRNYLTYIEIKTVYNLSEFTS
jgi:hypothetical protein